MKKIYITDYSCICNLGANIKEIFLNAINANSNKLIPDSNFIKGKTIPVGKVSANLPEISKTKYNTRCNRFLLHCLNNLNTQEILKKYSRRKIGIVIATTNTGVEEFSQTQNKTYLEISNPAQFLKEELKTEGFFCGVSVSCASGIKAFSLAQKLLNKGICDCVIAGGSDSLAHLAIHGFNSLEVLSDASTIPFSQNRSGINIGEGAALFILEKEPKDENSIEISGIGESSDAYHYSTPNPAGIQAQLAIEKALENANLLPEEIDYINLHGTGTNANDLMEATAINKIFGNKTWASSTKPLTGHCLGAAASIEAALCCALLSSINPYNQIYPHIYDEEYDKNLPTINLVQKGLKLEKLENVLSNAFGFGGANAVMILRRAK